MDVTGRFIFQETELPLSPTLFTSLPGCPARSNIAVKSTTSIDLPVFVTLFLFMLFHR